MAKPDDSEEKWIQQLDGLCSNLNVDPDAAQKSKHSFLEIKRNYTLDGDLVHWMACALYVACRTSVTPTVQSGTAVESNCVSLTKLLRLCNISLIQFFNKIKNWMEMASMPNDFKERISHLEHKFAVSTVLFRNFQPTFKLIFSGLTNEPVKTPNMKSKKHKMQPCTTNALFEFTWCLYICVKGEFQNSADDLVDMYHMLLCCLDFVFSNAFMARRRDLINPEFKGLPNDWLGDDFELPAKAPCIISILSEIKPALPVEAATMKEYNWKPVIKTFFKKGILKGNSTHLTGLLDVGNFDANQKSLNNLYETYVLSVGEFDERIFLGEHASEQIGTKSKVSGDEITEAIASSAERACPDTPLTGRRYVGRREVELTPVSEATNSLARLAAYLRHAKPQPSSQLLRLFTECGVSEETVNENVIQPCKQWMELFANCLRESKFSEETIKFRCNMVTCLYYKVFEHIIREEHRKKPQVSLQLLVSRETYQRAIYACCSEVVLHAYGVHSLRFPRVLAAYGLSPLHFYKVIELVVQAVVEKVSRDVIKHLNTVEEKVLESLVWTQDSPLWEQLSKTPVPASTEVYAQESPLHKRNNNSILSPVSTAIDRIVIPMADQAKKQLFKDNIKPGQSLLVPTNIVSKQESNAVQPATNNSNGELTPTSTPKKANNSLILFFRKFYSLAVVRMNDLCTRLRLTSDELKRKIWTCLEYSLMHQTQLMRDRHLDQILMCTVYVVCKISHNTNNPVERTFAEIMRCYRQRPLADNHVYRSVLITPATKDSPEEKSDLIRFYNSVYVQCMQDFALRFAGKQRDECGLSPLPAGRGEAAWSPAGQRVSERHQVYVKSLTTPPPHHHHLTYRFSRSPAKVAPPSVVSERHQVYVKSLTTPPPHHHHLTYRFSRSPAKVAPPSVVSERHQVYVKSLTTPPPHHHHLTYRFSRSPAKVAPPSVVSERHQVYVKSLTTPPPHHHHLTYRFSRSPAKVAPPSVVSERHQVYVKSLTTPPPHHHHLTYRFSRSPAKVAPPSVVSERHQVYVKSLTTPPPHHHHLTYRFSRSPAKVAPPSVVSERHQVYVKSLTTPPPHHHHLTYRFSRSPAKVAPPSVVSERHQVYVKSLTTPPPHHHHLTYRFSRSPAKVAPPSVVSERHQVYVKSLTTPPPHHHHLTYRFSRSPAKVAPPSVVSERHQVYVKSLTTPPPHHHHLTYRFSRSPAKVAPPSVVSERHQVYVKSLTTPPPHHHHLTYRFSRSPAKVAPPSVVSERHQVYVKSLTTPPPHHHHLTYRFSRSPAKVAPPSVVSERHQVYVKSLTTPPPHHHHLTYRFSRSPAKVAPPSVVSERH